MKKVLANSGKGSTFAPAFGRNEGEQRGEKAKFFESLRPAQDQRHCEAARGKEPFNKGTPIGTSRRNPRFRRKFENNNSTTKSLILAQDER